MIRYTLLGFFQDLRIRVSVFLKTGVQHPNGLFDIPTSGPVPAGSEVPGKIREYGPGGVLLKEETFSTGCGYEPPREPGSLPGHRTTTLGTNIYSPSEQMSKSVFAAHLPRSSISHAPPEPEGKGEVTSPDSSAKAELGLLLQLVGHDTDSETGSEFCLNLFEGEEPGESSTTDEANFDGGLLVTIDAPKRQQVMSWTKYWKT